MVNHDVVWLHISMHDSLAVTEVKRLQKLVDVIPNIVVTKARVERPEIGIVDVFEDKTGCLALAVPNDVQQRHDIGATRQVLEDLDLTLDLLLLDRLQNLDNTLLVVDHVDALEHLRVLPTTCTCELTTHQHGPYRRFPIHFASAAASHRARLSRMERGWRG